MIRRGPFKGHRGTISSIAFSLDDRYAVTGGVADQFFLDRAARIWDIPSGRLVRELTPHRWSVHSVAFSPDGRVVATGGGGIMRGDRWVYDNCIRIWDVATGQEVRQFGQDLFFVNALAFSPDGRFLARGSSNNAPIAPYRNRRCLRLWDWRSGEEVRGLGAHLSSVDSVSFSPDGRWLASGSGGMVASGAMDKVRTVRVFETDSGRALGHLPPYRRWVESVCFSADGRSLLSAGRDVLIWDVDAGQATRRLDLDSEWNVNCAVLASDGQRVVAGFGGRDEPGASVEDCCVRVLDAETGDVMARWEHDWAVTCLAVSHDSRFVLTGEETGALRLWQMPPIASKSFPTSAST